MGLFKRREADPAEIDRLRAEIAAMGARLNASEAAKGQLTTTVDGLVRRLGTTTPPPPTTWNEEAFLEALGQTPLEACRRQPLTDVRILGFSGHF